VVRINEQGKYTVRFRENGQYWDRCPPGKIRRDLRKPSAVIEIADDEEEAALPNTWQYKCLRFQESIPATFFICAIVFLELFLINSIKDTTSRAAWGLVITIFFLFEILLRFYNYYHTFHEVTGFFVDIFRIIDVLLVLIDVVLVIIIYTIGAGSDARAIRLIRIGRILRNAKVLKTVRSLRSLKFFWACITCKLPTKAKNMADFLHSTPWNLFIIMISILQFALVQSSILNKAEHIYILIVFVALFLVEIVLTIGIFLKLHADVLAFCKQPVQMIELILVIVAVGVTTAQMIIFHTVGDIVSYILFARIIRLAYITHRHKKDLYECCFDTPHIHDEEEEEQYYKKKQEEDHLELEVLESGEVKKSDLVKFSGNRGVKYGDSCIYQGDWVNGLEEGSGQLSFPNGDKYKGSFKGGLKHGRGLFQFAEGDTFRGSFVKNRKHGAGVYTWADGDKFEANFVNGYEHGKATFYSTDGRVVNYYFNNGIEIPTPDEESAKQNAAAASYKGLNFKEILAPGNPGSSRK
jgi:hypothetical protein